MLIAFLAGGILPIQAGLNAKMGKALGDPVYAALLSFSIGAVGLLLLVCLGKTDVTQISHATKEHWTIWTAGLLGIFYVVASIILVPNIGAGLTFALVIAGQLVFSILIDHFGLMGLSIYPINWQRIMGICLIIGGVMLIRNF